MDINSKDDFYSLNVEKQRDICRSVLISLIMIERIFPFYLFDNLDHNLFSVTKIILGSFMNGDLHYDEKTD